MASVKPMVDQPYIPGGCKQRAVDRQIAWLHTDAIPDDYVVHESSLRESVEDRPEYVARLAHPPLDPIPLDEGYVHNTQLEGLPVTKANTHARNQERHKPCSGRDELCREVLNDEWASHPTWASEDSGFIAHKKNSYEEALYRIEEERHDYDFNIQSCGRTIQLLEPFAQQLHGMTDAEQRAFQLPPALGGSSESIHKRVIYKVYGRQRGEDVVERLQTQPWVIIPVLLNRLRERKETWQIAQREWEKVWRDQTQKMFYKALDHQHIIARAADKRAFAAKTLQSEIAVRREEESRSTMRRHHKALHDPQLTFDLTDPDVIVDAAHLVVLSIDNTNLATDNPDLAAWFREMIPLYFGIDPEYYNAQIEQRRAGHSEDGQSIDEDHLASKGRKSGKSKSLLRNALDPDRAIREGSQASISRASTPGAASNTDADVVPNQDVGMVAADDVPRWMEHPLTGNNYLKGPSLMNADPEELYSRTVFTYWSNSNFYCMLRMFIFLYDRLLKLKEGEAACQRLVASGSKTSAAHDLGMIDKHPSEFFSDITPTANFYSQMIQKFGDLTQGIGEMADIEDILRRFYLTNGHGMYGYEKLVTGISRYANLVISNDGKERGMDMYQLFKKDRVKDVTSAVRQLDYRQAAERLVRDNEFYRITWDNRNHKINMWLYKKEDLTTDESIHKDYQIMRWAFYIASYTALPPTEGIDPTRLQRSVLPRNLRAMGLDVTASELAGSPAGDDTNEARIQQRINSARAREHLVCRIAVNNYQPLYQRETADWWFLTKAERDGGAEGAAEAEKVHNQRSEYMKSLTDNNNAMKDLSADDIAGADEQFNGLIGA